MTSAIGPIEPIASFGAGPVGPALSAGSVPLPSPGGDDNTIDRDGGIPIGPNNPTPVSPGAPGGGTNPSSASSFASALGDGLDAVAASQRHADQLAVQAATGRLTDPAQLTIATTQAQMMTQLATTIQSKAVTAFNTIMSMQA